MPGYWAKPTVQTPSPQTRPGQAFTGPIPTWARILQARSGPTKISDEKFPEFLTNELH
jgi:hypothetical protein